MTLRISPDLSLPVDSATRTFGILAKRGAGKSNAAVVMAEEMWDAGIAWVAIDPKGDWWGLRSSSDGKKPGLALPVFGGRHGDVPLEAGAGAYVADLVNDQALTCVLDVSEFSKTEQRRFLLDFANRLYRTKSDEGVVHLFLEEAHEYLPQRVMRDEAQLVGAWSRIVKQGRFRGIGATLVSQRSASLNKDVLTQVDTLIAMRVTAPQDRKAIEAWIVEHDVARELVDSLPGLADGEAWVWSPEFLGATQRVTFRRRRTFDSGATPEVGKARRAPATLADVDLAAIKEQMAETIERAKAADPSELRKRVKALERDLEQERRRQPEARVERVEVPVVDRQFVEEMRRVLGVMDSLLDSLRRHLDTMTSTRDFLDQHLKAAARQPPPAPKREAPTPPVSSPTGDQPRRHAEARGAADGLGKAHRLILAVLAQHGPRTRLQVALQAGYSSGGGGFGNALGALRSRGLVVTQPNGRLAITEEGIEVAPDVDPLPTGAALLELWLTRMGKGAAHKALAVLAEAWPNALTKAEVAERAGYEAGGGGFGNALGRLRTLELIEGRGELRVSDDLMDPGA